MRRLVLISALMLAWTAAADAQIHHGSGISTGSLGDAIPINFLRVHWGPPDSVRLAAAIVFRGTTQWAMTRGGADADRALALMDSARRDAERRGVRGGGTITARANAWVEFDERTATVTVLRRSYVVPPNGSALVLLIDRVDHIGGEPTIASVTIACATTADGVNDQRDPALAAQARMAAMTQHWQSCLRRDQRITDFLNQTSRAKRPNER